MQNDVADMVAFYFFQIHSLRKLYIVSTSVRGLSGWIFLLPNRWARVLFKSVLFDRVPPATPAGTTTTELEEMAL